MRAVSVATGPGCSEVSFDHRDVFLIDGAAAAASWGVAANAATDQHRWNFRLMARTSSESPPQTVRSGTRTRLERQHRPIRKIT